MRISVGIDSVDSRYGGCTTHALYRVFKRLHERGYIDLVLDYPALVRLNPGIPDKTRGNGAVALKFKPREGVTPSKISEEVASEVVSYVNMVRGDASKACAVVAIGGADKELYDVYVRALTDYVHLDYVRATLSKLGETLILPLGLNRGCVGALAAIGWQGVRCTYELLVYRHPTRVGRAERGVDPKSLALLDSSPDHATFCNYERGRVIAAPRGPDPVLIGIRGLDPRKLVESLKLVVFEEPVEGWILFKTNQATGDHMVPRASTELKPFRTGCVAGVIRRVLTMPGGDVRVIVADGYGWCRAVVFKETGLAGYARMLEEGDVVRLCGVMKAWSNLEAVLHVESLEVVDLRNRYLKLNPRCPRCGKRLKSAGRGKGYKCTTCGLRSPHLEPEVLRLPRGVREGVYLPDCGSVKHLGIPSRLLAVSTECCEYEPSAVSDFYSINKLGRPG